MPEAEWGNAFAAASRSAMAVYEEVLVPRMFVPWGDLLLDELRLSAGDTVLDVACGPGPVTRMAAGRVGVAGKVIGCDISAAMLAIARSKPTMADAGPIEYMEASAEQLPVASQSADAVSCQQGLQFFPDRPAALLEMRRILAPAGQLAVSVWAGIEQCPPFAAVQAALRDAAGPDFAERFQAGPWGMPGEEELRGLLEEAGFTEVRVKTAVLPVTFEGGAAQLLSTLATAPLATELESLPAERRDRLVNAFAEAVQPLLDGGQVRSHLTSHIATARR